MLEDDPELPWDEAVWQAAATGGGRWVLTTSRQLEVSMSPSSVIDRTPHLYNNSTTVI